MTQDTLDRPQTGRHIRAIVIGAIMTVAVNALEIFSSYILHIAVLNHGYVPMCTLMPFVLLILAVNPALKRVRPSWALRADELAIIFAMALIAAIFPAHGVGSTLIAILATPHYFASVENQWAHYLHPYIPSWLAPTDPYAVRALFEGLRPGEAVPYDVWVAPAFWWFLFIAAVFTVSLCGSVMLRKQWVERERLAFPLAQVPLELIESSSQGRVFPTLFSDRLFWMGFWVPMALILWNMIGYFFPEFPSVPVIQGYTRLRIAKSFPALFVRLNFFILAFAFLTELDVLFSVWFFHLFNIVLIGIYNRVGYTIGPADLWCGINAAVSWQSFGAFSFMVVSGLWMARKHLGGVLRKAVDSRYPIDDSDELIRYRTAVVGLVLGLVFMAVWLHAAGMEYRVAFVYVVVLLMLYLGVTKIVAQCGLMYLRGPITAQSATLHLLGTTTLAPSSMAALVLSFGLVCDAKTTAGTMIGHIVKLAGDIKASRRTLLLASLLALAIGMVASFVITLGLSHEHGAYNFGSFEFRSGNRYVTNDIVAKIRSPIEVDWRKLMFFGIGGVAMALMTFMRYRFVWWPLHPVGFTTGFIYPMRTTAFTIFLAWACKLTLVKLGGLRAYHRARRFFLGTLLGYIVGVTLSFIVDAIWFTGQGHRVHSW